MENGGDNTQANEQDEYGLRKKRMPYWKCWEEIVANIGRADCGQRILKATRKIKLKLEQSLPKSGLKYNS